MKTRLFLIVFFVLNIFQMSAQRKDEVTLVVSGDGVTKEEATKSALRSAIEQTYGTFVSANTQILNDELVKDEIVTVSNGNIKKFEEIAHSILSNGNQTVTLKATVSISKLVNYAQSKGASTEFAGATFAMNTKMEEIYAKNEREAIHNMLIQLSNIHNLFDVELFMSDPDEERNSQHINISGSVALNYNSNTELFNQIAVNTIASLCLIEADWQKHHSVDIPYWQKSYDGKSHNRVWMRNAYNLRDSILMIINYKLSSYVLKANTGEIFNLGKAEFLKWKNKSNLEKMFNYFFSVKDTSKGRQIKITKNFKGSEWAGLMHDSILMGKYTKSLLGVKTTAIKYPQDLLGSVRFTLKIPKDKIGQYSSFDVICQDD